MLNQILIPATMALSFFVFGTRYSCWQAAGAAVVLAGVGVAVGPRMARSSSSTSSSSSSSSGGGSDNENDNGHLSAMWVVAYIVGCLPQAAMNIIVERLVRKSKGITGTLASVLGQCHSPCLMADMASYPGHVIGTPCTCIYPIALFFLN